MDPLQVTRKDARVAALGGLIDYAGLFPPATLDMASAVAEYRDVVAGDAAWMVERFLCPASRLAELARVLAVTASEGDPPWRVAAIGDATDDRWADALHADLHLVRVFDEEMRGGARVEVVERRVTIDDDLADDVVEMLPAIGRMVFFELPWAERRLAHGLDALAAARGSSGRALGAKLRTGGVTADAFPAPEIVAEFVVGCRDRDLPMKATAGLHHPFRHDDPETGFTHHGFVNLLAAAALALEGVDRDTIAEVVAESDAEAFTLDAGGLRWREARVSHDGILAARQGLLVGYGSCSVEEPVEDLTALGILPVTT